MVGKGIQTTTFPPEKLYLLFVFSVWGKLQGQVFICEPKFEAVACTCGLLQM